MDNKDRYEVCGKIADNIEDLIQNKKKEGITQKEQAQKIGITPSALSKYISGNAIPDGLSLYKMAKYYNCTTDYLLGITKNPSQNLEFIEITNKCGLSLEAIQHLIYLQTAMLSHLEINLINILLSTKEGQNLIQDMCSFIFSKCINFELFVDGKQENKPSVNVNTTIGGYELFAPESDSVLLLDMVKHINKLKEIYSEQKILDNNHKVFVSRNAPVEYIQFLEKQNNTTIDSM